MAITVEVGLLSGRTAAVTADVDEGVETLRLRALSLLGVSKGQLLDSSGGILDGSSRIKRARVQNGDSLTVLISKTEVCSTEYAFAAIVGDASVATWGDGDTGGRSRDVQKQLRNVKKIQSC